MKKISFLLAFLIPCSAFAVANPVTDGYYSTANCPDGMTPCFKPLVQDGTATTSGASVGVASAQVVAAGVVKSGYLICNESATATVACNFGGTAVINGAGSFTFTTLQCISNPPNIIDTSAINCIASGAATPITIQIK